MRYKKAITVRFSEKEMSYIESQIDGEICSSKADFIRQTINERANMAIDRRRSND